MKKEDLLRAIGDIDDSFIEEAAPAQESDSGPFSERRRLRSFPGRYARIGGVLAAALVLVIGLTVFQKNTLQKAEKPGSETSTYGNIQDSAENPRPMAAADQEAAEAVQEPMAAAGEEAAEAVQEPMAAADEEAAEAVPELMAAADSSDKTGKENGRQNSLQEQMLKIEMESETETESETESETGNEWIKSDRENS